MDEPDIKASHGSIGWEHGHWVCTANILDAGRWAEDIEVSRGTIAFELTVQSLRDR